MKLTMGEINSIGLEVFVFPDEYLPSFSKQDVQSIQKAQDEYRSLELDLTEQELQELKKYFEHKSSVKLNQCKIKDTSDWSYQDYLNYQKYIKHINEEILKLKK